MRTLVKLVLIFFLLSVAGCAATALVAPVAGGISVAYDLYVKWKDGEATKYYHYNTAVVHRALSMALHDLGIPVSSDSAGIDQKPEAPRRFFHKKQGTTKGFRILAGNNNKFKVKIEPVETDISRLKVRIDFWGDKPYVEALYQKVDEYLNVVTFGPDGKPTLNEQRPNQPVLPHLP
jgi:hypothetical protein